MVDQFKESHKKEKQMVFQYVSYIKILCVPEYLFYSIIKERL